MIFIVMLHVGITVCPLHDDVRPWKIDKEHTNFYFSVDHIYAKVQGRFTDYKGTLSYDPDNLKDSEISFEIQVKSVETGIGKRDRHLRSADFFDASQYPLMTFTSNSITKAEENMYQVSGILTIKDVSTELVLPPCFCRNARKSFST